MRALNRSSRKRSSFALAAVLIISVCSGPSLVNARSATAAQKSVSELPARSRAGQPEDDAEPTRPRRVDPEKAGDRGPIVRIGLMADVTTLTLSASSGLIVRTARDRNGERMTGGPLRIELRQQAVARKPQRSDSKATTYTVEVATVSDPREARKTADDLKKRFSEPLQTIYDNKADTYRILIGRFNTRGEAEEMVERLRLAGHRAARIIADESKKSDLYNETTPTDSTVDTNAKLAKRQAQSQKASGVNVNNPAHQQAMQIIAFDADRMIALSDDRLIVSAGGASDGEEARQNFVKVNGKEYRGEIHLLFNSRGRINVVNALEMEDYLRGVVPLELSPSAFPAVEALKAQAIAARTYAIAHRGQFNAEGYDLHDDARSQVYGGVAAEREMTDRAIEATRGMIAVHFDENGNSVPIDALYTSTCGGRTEDNESAFGTKPVSYLRSVACSPDRQSFAGRDIISSRVAEPLINAEGRAITREVALAQAIGLSLPRRVTNSYLNSAASQDEIRSWTETAAQAARSDQATTARDDITRLAPFAQIVSSAIYGQGKAALILSPADVDYLLAGLASEEIPGEARADIALLLKNGALKLAADGLVKPNAAITRGQAIEIIARALYFKSQGAAKDALSIASLKTDTARTAENGRLIIASNNSAAKQPATREPRYTAVNAVNSSGARTGSNNSPRDRAPREVIIQEVSAQKNTPREQIKSGGLEGLEIENGARLFRLIGGESYAVDRVTLIGGERVIYHLNSAGRIDFLEVAASDRSASSDQVSSASQWQERVTIEELRRRIARSRVKVGEVEDLAAAATSPSGRVIELEVIGDEGRGRLRSSQIRNTLGLKENLFVIDRERDERGHIRAFVFTGRGWGHGVGMCQTGAFGLAKDGYSYTAILQKYYTGVKVQRMY